MTNNTMTREEKNMAKAAFPEYRGRKFRTRQSATYQMENYWDGGTRTYVKAVNLETGAIVAPESFTTNPMNGGAHAQFAIPQGVALVEHSFFCGADCGLTFITSPSPAIEAVR